MQAAQRMATDFAEGVWFIDLSTVTEAERIPQTIAHRLGLASKSGQPPCELLLESLPDRHLLLILGNCEHLTPACGSLAAEKAFTVHARIVARIREARLSLGEEAFINAQASGRALSTEDAVSEALSLLRYG
jgi:predicted ATPase